MCWDGGGPLEESHDSWRTIAPSASGRSGSLACTHADLGRIRKAFVDATMKAVRIGFDVIEMHAGRGYLLLQFPSPLSNQRSGEYGGDASRRMRFPLGVFDAIRAAAAPGTVLGVRMTASDWIDGGITVEDAKTFARELEIRG